MTGKSDLTYRLARRDDTAALAVLIETAIARLQREFLSEAQIAASRALMGLDTQLIDDGGYFLVELDGELAGCGGWSRRATLYGGDHSPGRRSTLLDTARDAARIRAMYTAPEFARRGVGTLILTLCEAAAAAEGFARVELVATLSGLPLYTARGYAPINAFEDDRGGAPVPLLRMEKRLTPVL